MSNFNLTQIINDLDNGVKLDCIGGCGSGTGFFMVLGFICFVVVLFILTMSLFRKKPPEEELTKSTEDEDE